MKLPIVIASVSIGLLISGCVTQPAGNQQTKDKVPAATVKPSTKTGETDRKIIANSFPSDIKGVNVVVTYNPGLKKRDYKAEHNSGMPLDDKYAKDRNLDKAGGKKYLHSKNANHNFNDKQFYAVLAFCEKHQIRTK